ncbi:helix-turn-helix domain-containing protein [Arthrobacter sp. 131MFCol6.1]|uniref:helix-turn-helix domain-containing protein n=1 Tax=Arthrobacter sp. 131MFCol6.1 TaxID=1157944 RepID=UPI0003A87F89|nr:helix-turn-helix domain-containing protein [Arthrobacter sp. 131MFCol6.1]
MNEEHPRSLRFFTVEQAAQEPNVSEAAIRSLLRSGELRGFQVGSRGQWRTGIDDLQAYIDEAYRKVEEKIAGGDFAAVEAEEA